MDVPLGVGSQAQKGPFFKTKHACLSQPTGSLGVGSAAVRSLFMINFPIPALHSHQAPQAFGFPLLWGRDPGWQLPGILFLGLWALGVGKGDKL